MPVGVWGYRLTASAPGELVSWLMRATGLDPAHAGAGTPAAASAAESATR
jgi:hypothetical protein